MASPPVVPPTLAGMGGGGGGAAAAAGAAGIGGGVGPSSAAAATAAAAGAGAGAGGSGISDRIWRKCNRMAETAMTQSPRVLALLSHIQSKGCALATPAIVCDDIFGGVSALAAYDATRAQVVMNPAVPEKFMEQREWTRSIAHELVHAYDYCRADIDLRSCRHMACTEIRASNLSGECDFSAELSRVGFPVALAGHQQRCVRRRAEKSVAMNAACVGADPKAIVAELFPACYADTAPFPTN